MKMRFTLMGLLACAGFLTSGHAGFYFTWNAPGSVNVGQNYTVGVQAYFTPGNYNDPYAVLGLYRNGSQVGGGSTGPYGSATASNSFTDNTAQVVSYSADIYSYYGESDYSSHSVTVNGGAPNQAPLTHSVTGTSPNLGSATTLTGHATDPDGNLAWLHFYVNGPGLPGWNHVGSASISGGNATASVNWTPSQAGGYAIHIRAQDALGLYDSNANVTGSFSVNQPNQAPTGTVRVNTTSINTGQQVIVSVDATDANGNLHYINIDQISPTNGFYGPGDTGTETPPNNGGYDLGGYFSSRTRDLTLTLNTAGTYVFRGAMNDDSGWHYTSNTVSVTVNQSPPPNQAPTGTVRVNTTSIYAGQQVIVSVDAADANGNLRYINIDQTSPTNGFYGLGDTGTEVPPNNGGYDLGANYSSRTRNLTLTLNVPGTYVFRGAMNDGSGWHYTSNTVSVTVGNAPDTTPPGAPQNLQITNITNTGFTASWTSPSGEVAAGYRVRLNSGGFTDVGSALSHTFSGLAAGTSYMVDVQARDASYNWSGSASSGVTTGGGGGGGSQTTGSLWRDVDADGIRDEIVRAGTAEFDYYVDQWYTTNVYYWDYLINNYWFGWDMSWYDDYYIIYDDFLWRWGGDVFWVGYETYFDLVFTAEVNANQPFSIYRDTSGSNEVNPANWGQPILHQPNGFPYGGTIALSWPLSGPSDLPGAQYFMVKKGLPVGSIEITSSSGTALGTMSTTTVTPPTVTLPAGTSLRIKVKDVLGKLLNVANNGVVFSVKDTLGKVVNLPNSGVLDILDIGIDVSGNWQIGVKIGDGPVVWFSINVQGPPPPPQVLLLLHGMNSNTVVWDDFVNGVFNGSSGDIRDGSIGPRPTPNSAGVYCYRLQFGFYDPASPRVGVEGVTAQNTPDYLNPTNINGRCGDFQTFAQLAQEVEAAIGLIHQNHPQARVVLLGHSRGGLAARAFLQAPPPITFPAPSLNTAKAAVVGLLTTSSPHQGSRLGRVYGWLEAHPRGQAGTDAEDWKVVDFLQQPWVVFVTIATPQILQSFPVGKKPTLDVRRPVIQDVADNSAEILSLNTPSSLQALPGHITYGEIVYDRVNFGLMSANAPRYSVLENETFFLYQLSSAAKSFLVGTGNTTESLHGDGLIPGASQRFTTLQGFSAPTISSLIVTTRDVVHTGAPHEVNDLVARLRILVPGWFP